MTEPIDRRAFLARTLAAAGALPLAGSPAAPPPPPAPRATASWCWAPGSQASAPPTA